SLVSLVPPSEQERAMLARLQADALPGAAISGLDLDPLATGADDRLDELPVGVFVAAIEQLGQGLHAVRSLVADAGEIERAERVVRRTDDEEPGDPAVEVLERISQHGSLEGAEMFAGTAAQVGAAGAQFVRAPG